MSDPSQNRPGDASESRLLRLFPFLRQRVLRKQTTDSSLRAMVEEVIEEHGDATTDTAGDLGDAERTMLRNVLDYGEIRVEDICVPRADVIAHDIEDGFDALVKLFAEASHSRVPVYRDTLDGIVGMVHVKDMVRHIANDISADAPTAPRQSPRVDQLLRSVLFVPPSMRVLDLLARMRQARVHMAIVVDEYGGTDGLITIEDLVEQIIGSIEDEHDDDPATMLRQIAPGLHECDARLALSELEEKLGVDFLSDDDDEEIDSVGGFISFIAGRVPSIGETIPHDSGYGFEIVDGDPRRLRRLRIHAPNPGADIA